MSMKVNEAIWQSMNVYEGVWDMYECIGQYMMFLGVNNSMWMYRKVYEGVWWCMIVFEIV